MRWVWIGLVAFFVGCVPGTQSATEPSMVLSPERVARGEHVRVRLKGFGREAQAFVADAEVPSTSLGEDTLVFFVPYGTPGGEQDVQIRAGNTVSRAKLDVLGDVSSQPLSPSLSPTRAARGEEVTVTLPDAELAGARVFVAGREARTVEAGNGLLSFVVPGEAPGGPQEVLVVTLQNEYREVLGVLGDVVQDEVIVILERGVTREEFLWELARLNETLGANYGLKEEVVGDGFTDLGGEEGPCGGTLAEIVVGDRPLGQALEELERLRDILWGPDPMSVGGGGAVDHVSAIHARQYIASGLSGAGNTIAVLDTGVSEHEQLGSRLKTGFDFIDGDIDASDNFTDSNLPGAPDNDGHGTPIAIIAAGEEFGVAPGADILPVRVCDQGECLASNVIKGMCFALREVAPEELVFNLSFGGDTPVDIVEALLRYALGEGVLVAAAGGNEGEKGSPPHYPAAYDLPGLVAVGALEQRSEARTSSFFPASFSNRGSYLDVAAPGVNLLSGAPGNLYQEGYDGTSFAAPQVAGAMAVLREAGLSKGLSLLPTDIEACIRSAAQPPLSPGIAVGRGMLDVGAALAQCP